MNELNKPKPLIAFDLGAVLIDWDPRYLYRKLFNGDDAAMETFLTEVCSPAWNVQQDAGRPFSVAIASLIAEHPEQADLIHAFFGRWQEMLGGAIQGGVDVLREVKALGFPVVALSNWSAETFPLARDHYPFLEWFDDVVLSGQEQVAKPDLEIYRILFKRTGYRAEDCIFIDDSLMNIEAARSLGILTVHFQSPEQLRRDLSKLHPQLAALNV